MRIKRLTVQNYRGIASLDWTVHSPFACVIGPGDSGKSSVLDAIEAALSSRWITFTEADFFQGDTRRTIQIEVTIAELSRALKSDDRFGLFIRGWTNTGTLRDEPEDDDEPVLSVRLEVDATMEPVWQLVCDRALQPRILSSRDRLLFGLVRLAGDDARNLSWGQGSVLSRITEEKTSAAAPLAEAYRRAREAADFSETKSLCDAADKAQAAAKILGSYIHDSYRPALELGRAGFSTGAIALHDGTVPLRMAGLGTRRLAVLAIQKSLIEEGAIVLIDEIEHGLEPHRILAALSILKADQTEATLKNGAVGQLVMTTHSDVVLEAAGPDSLAVIQCDAARKLSVSHAPPNSINTVLRHSPRALLARRIMLCEGDTELGVIRGLSDFWTPSHNGQPFGSTGSTIVDGHGSTAVVSSCALGHLGYRVAWFRDTDRALTADQIAALKRFNVTRIEYAAPMKFEDALFQAATDEQVDKIISFAKTETAPNNVEQCLEKIFPPLKVVDFRDPFSVWGPRSNHPNVRKGLGDAASVDKRSWFKNEVIGRKLAPIVREIVTAAPASPLATVLAEAERWLYGL